MEIYDILDWARLTFIADEMVIPTLARISEATEQANGSWVVKQDNVPLGRYHYQLWKHKQCHGKLRHSVCVFSLSDLASILQSQCIIFNKVMSDYDPVIAECIRDNVRNREILQ